MTPTRKRVCVFKYIAHVNHIGTNMGTSFLIRTLLTRLPILHSLIQTKPSLNETTTPVLKARDARRGTWSSPPRGQLCEFHLFRLSKVTHKYGSDAQARARVIELAFPVNIVGANVGAKYLY